MASKFWVDVSGLAAWDATLPTPWSDTDGGPADATPPVDGDAVYFTSNSFNPPLAGPGVPLVLSVLDFTGYAGPSFPPGLTADILIPGGTLNTVANVSFSGTVTGGSSNIGGDFSGSASGGAVLQFASGASCTGASLTDSTAYFYAGSTCNSLTLTGTNNVNFVDTTLNALTVGGVANVFNFSGSAINNLAFNAYGTVNFVTGSIANNAVITADGFTVLCHVTGNGSGGLTGPITVGANGLLESNLSTGDILVEDGGILGGANFGNLTITEGQLIAGLAMDAVLIGPSSVITSTGSVNGNASLAGGAQNKGTVLGVLTTPASDNGDGTWGSTSSALGSFGTLRLTGIPSGGSGGGGPPIWQV